MYRTETEKKELIEYKVDEEVNQRAKRVYTYHIKPVSDRINGITLASTVFHRNSDIFRYVTGIVEELITEYGEAYPSDVKRFFKNMKMGVSVCDGQDQFSRIEGRIRAKKSWLRSHPRLSSKY